VLPTNHFTKEPKTGVLLIDVQKRTVTHAKATSLSHAAIADWINATLRHNITRLFTWSLPNGDTMFFDAHRNQRTFQKAGGKGFHLPTIDSIRHVLGNAIIIGGTYAEPAELRTEVVGLGIEWKHYPSRLPRPHLFPIP
jgi:hypothetical protein